MAAKVKSYLIRVGGLVVVLAGTLRALAAVLPVSTPQIMTLYLVIDVLLLVSSIVLFEFQRLDDCRPGNIGSTVTSTWLIDLDRALV